MLIKVSGFHNFKYINKGIRTEDIQDISESIEEEDKTIITFDNGEELLIDETFDSFFSRLEKYYNDDSRDLIL